MNCPACEHHGHARISPRGRHYCPECGAVRPVDQRPTPHFEGKI
jgi:transcription initiation factor TFIIIB Brf1 subunit/transcription initiation factor TFIIB